MKTTTAEEGASLAPNGDTKELLPVVITLVHGTILFARWRWVVKASKGIYWFCLSLARFGKGMFRLQSAQVAKELTWNECGSKFARSLEEELKKQPKLSIAITSFTWSGFNTEWGRLCAAGADGDFSKEPRSSRNQAERTLRQHVAGIKEKYPGAKQVLIAHSHAGNICLASLLDDITRAEVAGVVCLSTPFINVRQRTDSARVWFLQGSFFLTFLVVLYGSFILTEQWLPGRGGTIFLYGAVFSVLVSAGLYMGLGERRREVLRNWALTKRTRLETPLRVIHSDGDEALLGLKIAEAMNAILNWLWVVPSIIPVRAFRLLGKLWKNPRLAVSLHVIALVIMLCLDKTLLSMSVASTVSFFLFGPEVMIALLALVLALPALIALIVVYPGTACFRWLAFGWPGYSDIEMTGETTPLGTSVATRLEPFETATGLRHGYSYNHPETPGLIAAFIREILGK